ncbi:MAG: iron ABC transporter permease [Gammaproteobacteria bacterium]|nr:iron ABC transporter permease [Gammaproteobacteria bacterium]|tara:strand:+ start:1143 stop:2774 length:1632 start_codon:yes stop_codon:yes gene_type:complete
MFSKILDYKDQIFLYFVILVVITPIITVLSYVFSPSTHLWGHLADNLLLEYLSNTFLILMFVSLISVVLGVSCAWLVTMYQFPGKDIFKWLLIMPIAIPTYVSAYIYAGLVEPSGFLFESAESTIGLGKELYNLINLRNIYGVIFILSICLYPYIYLITYSSFKEQSYCAIEVGKSLGLNKKELFRKISIPLARPGIIAGLSLVMMETLAEFGTMDYYGVSTFTTGIYRTWFAFDDDTSALHLASILLTFVFILMILEKYSRGRSKYNHSSQKTRPMKPINMSMRNGIYAFLWCLLIVLLGFIIPIIQLFLWLIDTYSYLFDSEFLEIITNTIIIGSFASVLIVLISIYASYVNRSTSNMYTKFSLKIFSIGYSIPGVVIAVGIIIPITLIDDLQAAIFGSPIFYLSGSFIALIIAYLVRFSTISFNATESGLSKIKNNIDLTAKSFGFSNFMILKNIHIPMMKTTVITALILVFVDIVKELPATLILRPFNFDTLAIHIYELASSEQLSFIASPALMLITIGLIPVIILIRKTVGYENEIRD